MTTNERLNDPTWIKAQWMECEVELIRMRVENKKLRKALEEIARVPEFLPEDFEHRIAAQALGWKQ
jgi:hypothetical protein